MPNSHTGFNAYFKEPVTLFDDGRPSCIVISAELYSAADAAREIGQDRGIAVDPALLDIGYVRFQGGPDKGGTLRNTWWMVGNVKGAKRVWALDWETVERLSGERARRAHA